MTMTLHGPAPYPGEAAPGMPVLDVVIPVYNEQNDLEPCGRQLHAHLPEKGRGRALRTTWLQSDAGARLHGRRPVHRPGDYGGLAVSRSATWSAAA